MRKEIYDEEREGFYQELTLEKFFKARLDGLFLGACESMLPGGHGVVYHLGSYHVTVKVIYYRDIAFGKTAVILFGEEQRIGEVERIIKEEAEKHKPKSIETTVGR